MHTVEESLSSGKLDLIHNWPFSLQYSTANIERERSLILLHSSVTRELQTPNLVVPIGFNLPKCLP